MLHSDPDNKSFHFMFVRWTTSLLPNVKDQQKNLAHLQSSVFKLSKDLIDSIHEEGIVAYTS